MNKKSMMQIGAVVFVFILGIGYGVKHHHRAAESQEASVVVEAEKVKLGNIPIEAKAVGTLTAEKKVQITPEFTGLVAMIHFHDGSFVKKGTPLIQLDDKVTRSKAESTKAALFYSATNYKRMVLLGKQGAISRQAIESAAADLKQKQADAQENQVTVEKMQLIAPFDGVLGKSQVSPGDYVTAGQPVVMLTDILHLRVEYSVSEKYLPQLKLGQQVKLTTSAYPGKEFVGKVAYISPTINADDRTISVYAELVNDDRLLTAGLFVNVTQFLGTQNSALMISPLSLVPTIDGHKIYKIVNGKAVSVPVVIGERNSDNVQIDKGVSANDVVITAGQEKLKDGMAVTMKS
jgi:membrane fusion protein (multidrug efflux system)